MPRELLGYNAVAAAAATAKSRAAGNSWVPQRKDRAWKVSEAIAFLEEEGLYHFRDTLYYDLYKAQDKAGNANDAIMSLQNAYN
ncbi:hypothetical protein M408DRAFT_30510 [Serendipita vermifera MAFF 305830]|uniref:Uncharacterized protein n=1 Tax=Serendipita vermifera MAFF 305830 TaxID=933852 RepID=A0A0C2W175_SERVB|nr:hypothetical protein M408DRAFT_30510 [Serendipita vermifera MAFF 305830]